MRIQIQEKTPEPVDRDRALAHAQLTVRRDWAANIHGFNHWHQAELDPKPLVLHDLNGAELFYEFTLRRGNDAVGSVKASASKTLGSPVVAVETGPRRWDPEEATRRATEKARRQFPKSQISNTSLICYGYPKIGVRVDLTTDGQLESVIYDVSSLVQVTRFGSDQREGLAAWSFYETIALPHAEKKIRRWELSDRELDEVGRAASNVFATAFTDQEADRLREALVLQSQFAFIELVSSRVLKYGPRCTPHDCFMLYAQQTDVYCAVATGQMILDFHRWPYTQDQIATAMNTDASGTDPDDQATGIESLTNNSFNATVDYSADWSEAKAEIDANRPLKSGIPGHARACAGWKRQNIFIVSQPPKRWLQIYDPWPWNANICQGGAVVWEDWDAVSHTNFMYVRHA
jgi:hypothetical protein